MKRLNWRLEMTDALDHSDDEFHRAIVIQTGTWRELRAALAAWEGSTCRGIAR